jgi:hypothetical protein
MLKLLMAQDERWLREYLDNPSLAEGAKGVLVNDSKMFGLPVLFLIFYLLAGGGFSRLDSLAVVLALISGPLIVSKILSSVAFFLLLKRSIGMDLLTFLGFRSVGGLLSSVSPLVDALTEFTNLERTEASQAFYISASFGLVGTFLILGFGQIQFDLISVFFENLSEFPEFDSSNKAYQFLELISPSETY